MDAYLRGRLAFGVGARVSKSAVDDDILRKLWAQGMSAKDIAERMPGDITKNMIIGRAHRLKLAARPSPIKTNAVWTAAELIKVRELVQDGASNNHIAAIFGLTSSAVSMRLSKHDIVREKRDLKVTLPKPPKPPRPVTAPVVTLPQLVSVPVERTPPMPIASSPRYAGRTGRIIDCCWPIGNPGEREFRFCGDASVPSKPYCTQHCLIAYKVDRDAA